MTIENNFGGFMHYKQNAEISALDVAAYIVNYLCEIPTTKLWWLVYMCQVWCLVWNNNQAPLFKEDLEAWVNGPMVRKLYDNVGDLGKRTVWRVPGGRPGLLDIKHKMHIQKVIGVFGKLSILDIVSSLAMDLPWKITREGYDAMEACTNVIDTDIIYDYYKDKHIEEVINKKYTGEYYDN